MLKTTWTVSPLGRAPNPPLAQTSAATDKDALLAIFNATDGPSWDDSGTWAGRAPIGDWPSLGVTTDEDGRVVQLIVNLGGSGDSARGHVDSPAWGQTSADTLAIFNATVSWGHLGWPIPPGELGQPRKLGLRP